MSPAIEEMKASSTAIGLNAQKVVSKRYSLKDQQGNPIEDWPAIVRRVVTHVDLGEICLSLNDRAVAEFGGSS